MNKFGINANPTFPSPNDPESPKDRLLDKWYKEVYIKSDEAMERYENTDSMGYNAGLHRGYSDGLLMALTMYERYVENTRKGK